MKRGPRRAALVLLALILGACATTGPAQPAPGGSRVRCLVDPGERGTRPLILFFCIQNP